jgi:hypothetical protein
MSIISLRRFHLAQAFAVYPVLWKIHGHTVVVSGMTNFFLFIILSWALCRATALWGVRTRFGISHFSFSRFVSRGSHAVGRNSFGKKDASRRPITL